MLSGLMMQIAMQLGLHRPVQAEEFTTFQMAAQGEALKDRLHTWIICNMVAQKYVHRQISTNRKPFANYMKALQLVTVNLLAQCTTGLLSLAP